MSTSRAVRARLSRLAAVAMLALVPSTSVASDLVPGVDPFSDPGLSGQEVPGSSPQARERLVELGRARAAREAERERFVESPAGAQEREESRTAFDGLSDTAAVDVLLDVFASEIKPLVPDAETLVGGGRIDEFLDDLTVRVEGGPGQPDRIIDSQVPLRVPGTAGEATDFDLVARDGAFVPDSGLAELELPERSVEGIDVGAVEVTPDGSADVERVDADTLAYPNIEPSVDLAVNATPDGFETFHQLRGPDAPESLGLDLTLPAGASVAAVESGGAQIKSGDGEPLASVTAPVAVDAQGTDVPAKLRVVGDKLEIDVRHRNRDFAYPILVDPAFIDDDSACGGLIAYPNTRRDPTCKTAWFQGQSLSGIDSWWAGQTGGEGSYWWADRCVIQFNYNFDSCQFGSGYPYSNWAITNPSGSEWWSQGKTGLHLWAGVGWLAGGKLGEWVYKTPGANFGTGRTAQVYRTDFGARFLRMGSSNGCVKAFTGVYSYAPSIQNWVQGAHYATDHNFRWDAATTAAAHAGPQVPAFGLINTCSQRTWLAASRQTYMGATIVQLTDPEPATVTNFGLTGTNPSTWTKDGSWTVAPTTRDSGLGVQQIKLGVPQQNGTTATHDTGALCWGTAPFPCNADQSLPYPFFSKPAFTFSAADANGSAAGASPVKDGVTTLTLNAYDPLGKSTPRTTTIKVDRSGPTIATPTGPLYENRNGTSDHRKEGLYDPQAALSVTASDPHSGTKKIQLLIDRNHDGDYTDSGEELAKKDNTAVCAGGQCPTSAQTLTHTLDTDSLPDSDYNLKLVAYDGLDTESAVPTTWTVTVDRQGDVYKAQELSGNPQSGGELYGEEAIRFGTKTARRETADAITTRTLVACRDDDPNGPKCAESRYRTLGSQLGTGDEDTFSRYRGSTEDDPNIDQIATLLDPADYQEADQDPVATGSLLSVTEPWQTLPPGRGSQYELYEATDDDGSNTGPYGDAEDEFPDATESSPHTVRVWVDSTTRLPVKWEISKTGVTETTYWTYERDRAVASTLPADYFKVSEPGTASLRASSEERADTPVGATTDHQTGSQFTPYYLGPSLTAAGLNLCLDSSAVFHSAESTGGDIAGDTEALTRDVSDITRVDADYALLPQAASCLAGQSGGEEPAISVSSFASASGMALALKDEIIPEAQAIEADQADPDRAFGGLTSFQFGQPRTVYVAPGEDGEGSVAVFDIGTTTVFMRSPLPTVDLAGLLSDLEDQ